MKIRNYILAETNWKHVSKNDYNVVILPWGATEAHNYHLPYTTDVIQSDYISAEAARKATDKGAKVIVLPAIPFGVNTGQLDIKLCINLNPSTQAAIIYDVVYALKQEGFNKLVILNSHGGNDFKQILREVQLKIPGFTICQINWFRILNNNDYFDEPGDHAGELETCVMLNIKPEFVLPLSDAGKGKERKMKIKAFKEGWAWTERKWTKITEDTGVGNPAKATKEKGEKYLEIVTDKISDFLVDFDKADLNDMYE